MLTKYFLTVWNITWELSTREMMTSEVRMKKRRKVLTRKKGRRRKRKRSLLENQRANQKEKIKRMVRLKRSQNASNNDRYSVK